MPGIYRRGSRYVVASRDATGNQCRRSAAAMAEARTLKAALTADLARGEYREQSRVTLNQYAREWVLYAGRTSRGILPTNIEEYWRDLEAHVLPVLGPRRLSRIEPRQVKLLASDLAAAGQRASTVRNIMAPLRALFATAVEEGVLRSNPCAGLRLPGGTTPDRHARALTEPELARLLAEVPQSWQLLVQFLAQTGLRIGELIALRWADVDLGVRRVKVRRRLYKGTVDAPKSRYGIRDVPISSSLAQALWNHRTETRSRRTSTSCFPARPEHRSMGEIFYNASSSRRGRAPGSRGRHCTRCATPAPRCCSEAAGTPSRCKWCWATTPPPSPSGPTST